MMVVAMEGEGLICRVLVSCHHAPVRLWRADRMVAHRQPAQAVCPVDLASFSCERRFGRSAWLVLGYGHGGPLDRWWDAFGLSG